MEAIDESFLQGHPAPLYLHNVDTITMGRVLVQAPDRRYIIEDIMDTSDVKYTHLIPYIIFLFSKSCKNTMMIMVHGLSNDKERCPKGHLLSHDTIHRYTSSQVNQSHGMHCIACRDQQGILYQGATRVLV